MTPLQAIVPLASGALAGLLLAGCATPAPAAPGLANPASVYCEQSGGTLQIRDETGGEVGYCLFSDGSECEEWQFFRGECGLDYTFCASEGGTPEVREDVLTCVFGDGSACPEAEHAAGTCK